MKIEKTNLSGVLVLTPARFGDNRGFFSESWNRKTLRENGIDIDFVQDNHSFSTSVGTIRGLHFQSPPHAQAKLVRCGRGILFDLTVDIRVGSPTFGMSFGVELSAENGKQLLIPKGFLHGFVTRAPETEIIYKCSDYYVPDCEGAVRFDDPVLNIDWGVDRGSAVVSEKDLSAPLFSEFKSPFIYEERT